MSCISTPSDRVGTPGRSIRHHAPAGLATVAITYPDGKVERLERVRGSHWTDPRGREMGAGTACTPRRSINEPQVARFPLWFLGRPAEGWQREREDAHSTYVRHRPGRHNGDQVIGGTEARFVVRPARTMEELLTA